jgi:hypothetical protein
VKTCRALGLFALAALLSAQAAHADNLVLGSWYEDMKQRGYRTISIMRLHGDGTFSAEFRTCLPQGALDEIYKGHWSYANGQLVWRKESYNGAPMHLDEVYQTLSIDKRIWDYRLIKGGPPISFHDVRVTADSKMPGCDITS